MRSYWALAVSAVAGAAFLSGCDAGPGSSLDRVRGNPAMQNTARAIAQAHAYDRLDMARRFGDEDGVITALEDLSSVQEEKGTPAEQAVRAAVLLDGMSENLEGEAKKKLQERAAEKYRQAQQEMPRFNSSEPDLLNALGYFLAESGDKPQDFLEAERLTRAALALVDKQLATLAPSTMQHKLLRLNREVGPHDSLVWALYRQGKYDQALKEQTAVIKTAEELSPQFGQKVSADLYYHLGKIYEALKNDKAAREQFDKALEVEPDHEDTKRALTTISV